MKYLVTKLQLPPELRSLCLLFTTEFVEPPPPPRTKFLGTPLTSSDDSALTEWLRSTPQSKDVDWWKMEMDVNQMSKSSTDVGECDISNVVASDTRTILIIQIM